MKQEQRQDKGVAGLTILLSLVVMLFVIGLLVMIFAIMSGKMQDTDTLYTRSGNTAVVNDTLTTVAETGENFDQYAYRGAVCNAVSSVLNATDGIVISSGNYTQTNCAIAFKTGGTVGFNNTNWKVTYTYNYLEDGSGAVSTINDTGNSIASVTDWFDIFIVIGAMVVLILLTVVIITSIRSSGMVAGGSQGANQVGTA